MVVRLHSQLLGIVIPLYAKYGIALEAHLQIQFQRLTLMDD